MTPGAPIARRAWMQRRTRLGVRRDRPLEAPRRLPAATLLHGLPPKLAYPGDGTNAAALAKIRAARKRRRDATRWLHQYGSRAYMAALHRRSCACAGRPRAGPCGGPIEAAHLIPKGREGYVTTDGRGNIAALCRTHHTGPRGQEKRTDAFIAETGVDLWRWAAEFYRINRHLIAA